MLNLENQIFGRLTVLKQLTKDKYICICKCGKTKELSSKNLLSKRTNSCGCLKTELLQKRTRKQVGEGGFNSLYRSYKTSAKFRKLSFNLTKEEFKNLTKQNCFYCNINPEQIHYPKNTGYLNDGYEHAKYLYNGIDRIDNNLGYILANCVPCCKICNKAKNNMSLSDFKNWIEQVYSHTIWSNLPY